MFQTNKSRRWVSLLVLAMVGSVILGCRPAGEQLADKQARPGKVAASSPAPSADGEVAPPGGDQQSSAPATYEEPFSQRPSSGWITEVPPNPGLPPSDQSTTSGWVVPDQPPFASPPQPEGRPQTLDSPPSASPLPGVQTSRAAKGTNSSG